VRACTLSWAILADAGLDLKDVAAKNRKGSKKPSIITQEKEIAVSGIQCHAEPLQPPELLPLSLRTIVES
jgi:hypothetical protein